MQSEMKKRGCMEIAKIANANAGHKNGRTLIGLPKGRKTTGTKGVMLLLGKSQ